MKWRGITRNCALRAPPRPPRCRTSTGWRGPQRHCGHTQLRRTRPPVPRGCASVAVRLIKLQQKRSHQEFCGILLWLGHTQFGQCTLKVDYLENSLFLARNAGFLDGLPTYICPAVKYHLKITSICTILLFLLPNLPRTIPSQLNPLIKPEPSASTFPSLMPS